MKQAIPGFVPCFPKDITVRRLLRMLPLLAFNGAMHAGCSGVPFTDCRVTTAGGNSAAPQCGVGGNSGAAGAAGDASSGGDGATVGSLVPNGSFEDDQQPASAVASSAPNGWTMLSSASPGNLLHALKGDESSAPAAAQGRNLATFDSLTASSYREALSNCFPIQAARTTKVLYDVMVPATQNSSGTRAAVKIWYFEDGMCATPSAIRTADTQTATANSAPGVWELRQYAPSQQSPADSLAARVSIRAAYNAGTDCGTAGTNCAADRLYFDAIDVVQTQ